MKLRRLSTGQLSLGTILVLLVCAFCTVGAEVVCSRISPPKNLISSNSGPGLGPLLSSTRQSRGSIFNQELPYDAIRTEISRVYNISALRVSPFVTEWLKYSINAFYLTGFVLFVAVTVPLVLFSFWLFWKCCYQSDGEGCFQSDENEMDHFDRNQSCYAQTVAWSLSITILILVIVQIGFIAILLFGNSFVRQGVRDGGRAVSSVLRETERVRNEAVDAAEDMIVDKYELLLTDIYLKLKTIPEQLKEDVERDQGPVLRMLYDNVTNYLSLRDQLLERTELLSQFVQELSPATPTAAPLVPMPTSLSLSSTLLASLSSSLRDVKDVCSELVSSNFTSVGVASECSDLLNRGGGGGMAYSPEVAETVGGLGGLTSSVTNLQLLRQFLGDEIFSGQPATESCYLDYLEALSDNFTCCTNSTWGVYLGKQSTLYSNLTSLWGKIALLNVSLSLGLPASQAQLDVYLGPRYLENWEEFRHVCTIIFAVVLMVLLGWLLAAILRGLYNLYEVYEEGEAQAKEGLHQSGTAIIKLTFMLTCVCVISALSCAATLVIAGGVGQACHPSGDLSRVLRMVVDDNRTWRGVHLLGQAVLDNASYPLTFESLLSGCQRNLSVYQALQLDQVFNLDSYFTPPGSDIMRQFETDLRALWDGISNFVPLSPLASEQLRVLGEAESVPVRWEDFLALNLSYGLFRDSFVGLEELQRKLNSMSLVAMEQTPPNSNLSVSLNSASASLSALTEFFNSDLLPSVRSSASFLSHSLAGNRSSLLLKESEAIGGNVSLQARKTARINISQAVERVSRQFSAYLMNTTTALTCDVGSCHTLSVLADRFTSSMCDRLVSGMDLYWSSLMALLVFNLLIMVLSFVLASRFVDHTHEKSSSKFNLTGAVMRQVHTFVWFGVGVAVNCWLVAAIGQDRYFHEALCRPDSLPGCCPVCVWVMGVVFLLLSCLAGLVSRVYQCIILHRLSKGVKKVKRYWMDKKKAARFYGQAAILLLQDFPFLILAGVYTNALELLTIPAFLALAVSLLGISSYVLYFVQERGNVHGYLICLRNEFRQTTKFQVHGAESGVGGGAVGGVRGVTGQALALNGRAASGRYVINSESEHSESDSQGTTQHADDLMYDPSHHTSGHGDHRLSVIPEHIEGAEHMGNVRGSRGGGMAGLVGGVSDIETASSPAPSGLITVPVYVHPQDSDVETTPNEGMRLDRTNSPTESALRHRREAAQLGIGAGFEVASMRHYDTSSASGFGSKMSMTASGYCSSSQPPDDMYESSDYRDDDSDYSVHPNRLRLPALPCEMSVEV